MNLINDFRKPAFGERRDAAPVLRFCCGASNVNALRSRDDLGERE
jgi:hypothetical protein